MWPSGVTFNREVSSSWWGNKIKWIKTKSDFYTYLFFAVFFPPWPLRQRTRPMEALYGLSAAHSHRLGRREDSLHDASWWQKKDTVNTKYILWISVGICRIHGAHPLLTPHTTSSRQSFDLLVTDLTFSTAAFSSDPVMSFNLGHRGDTHTHTHTYDWFISHLLQ